MKITDTKRRKKERTEQRKLLVGEELSESNE